MSLQANQTSVKASMAGRDSRSITGFGPVTHDPEITFSAVPNSTTYGYALLDYGTLAAGANTTIDLYSFTTEPGEAVTATKLAGYECKASLSNTSNTGGQLRIEQGATNAASGFLGGTTPNITLTVGASGCCVLLMSGSHETLSNTTRNLLVSNPGTNSITYSFFALVGT